MKSMLLALMVLASVAMANDAKMKALLVGTWAIDDERTYTFTSDGRWFVAKPPDQPGDLAYHWDVKDGELIQIRDAPESARPYPILFLTEHECLLHWTHHGGGYSLWTR
jgi:hypothetical protein